MSDFGIPTERNGKLKSKSAEIASILTKAILNHRLTPGEKLGERELAEILGTSRIVVRQALIELSEAGLVHMQRNRGAFVAKPSLQETLEIFDALTMIEQYVAEIVAERFSASATTKLRHLLEKQKKAADEGNDELSARLGRSFHAELVQLSQNRVVQDIHTQLSHRASLLSSLYHRVHDACSFAKDHENIIEMIDQGRVDDVKRLIQIHNDMVARSHKTELEESSVMGKKEALAPYLPLSQSAM